MDTAERGSLDSVIELWLSAKEIDRLADRLGSASDAELESLSHYITEPAAERLAGTHPGVAAKVFRAFAFVSSTRAKANTTLKPCRTSRRQGIATREQSSMGRGTR